MLIEVILKRNRLLEVAMNIFAVLEKSAHYFPRKPAIIYPQGENCDVFSYSRLLDLASRFSGGLANLGVFIGDHVAVFLPNISEYPAVTYGAMRIGAVPALLSSAAKKWQVREYLTLLRPQVLVTSEEMLPELEQVIDKVVPRNRIIFTGHPTSTGMLHFAQVLSRHDLSVCDLDPSAHAMTLMTGGTTGGKVKGAMLSHGNVVSNVHATNHHVGMRQDDIMMCFLPLFHCFGQNFIMNATFNVGATMVLHKRFVLKEVLDSIKKYKVSMFFAVPVVYDALMSQSMDAFSTVRYFFSAGAPLSPELAHKWHDRFERPIYQGYGLTETTPFAAYNCDPTAGYRHDSVGTSIENVEIKIVDDDGCFVAGGERGEVIVRGPNVFLGYYNDPVMTRAAIKDGWLYTGDIGRFDQGHLQIVDRKKDMLKVGGFAVFPADIEEKMRAHFGVRIKEMAVVGVPDKKLGEAPYAFVVRGDESLGEEEVIRVSREKLTGYQALRYVRFADSLPKTPKGTVLKYQLRDMLQGQETIS